MPFMLSSLILTLCQMISTTWCSANGQFYGYFQEGNVLRSCVFEMPGSAFFNYGAIAMGTLGVLNMFIDAGKALRNWKVSKSINISRVTFLISMVSVTAMLELVANAYNRELLPALTYLVFDNFFYLFPITLLLFIASAYSIGKKVELIFSLDRRG